MIQTIRSGAFCSTPSPWLPSSDLIRARTRESERAAPRKTTEAFEHATETSDGGAQRWHALHSRTCRAIQRRGLHGVSDHPTTARSWTLKSHSSPVSRRDHSRPATGPLSPCDGTSTEASEPAQQQATLAADCPLQSVTPASGSEGAFPQSSSSQKQNTK